MQKPFIRTEWGAFLLTVLIVGAFVVSYLVMMAQPFTSSEYEKVRHGMSVSQVSKVLRTDGKMLYENTRSDGTVVVSYTWTNPDGSYVSATFENDRLRRKSERGLSK